MLYVAIVWGFIPLILLLLYCKRRSPDVSAIAPYVVLIAVSSAYEFIANILSILTAVWYRIYGLMDFVLMYYFFRQLLPKFHRRWMWLMGLAFGALYVVLLFYWNELNPLTGDSYLFAVQTVFLYICAVLWFNDIFTNLTYESLWQSPAFYFVSGYLLYFSGTLFLFLMSHDIVFNEKLYVYWKINISLNIVLRILIAIGIWKGARK